MVLVTELVILGCMDESACNFNSQSNVSDGSCSYPELYQDCQGSCINGEDIQGNCIDVIIEGCLDELHVIIILMQILKLALHRVFILLNIETVMMNVILMRIMMVFVINKKYLDV